MAARRIRHGRTDRRLFDLDTSELDRFGQILSLSNAELRKQFLKRTRSAAKRVQADIKGEAPIGPSGALRRSGVRLSVSRAGVFIRIVGAKARQPSNIGYLVTRGHRNRGGGKTRANQFVERGLRRSFPFFEKEMIRAMDDTIKWMARQVGNKSRRPRQSFRRGRPSGGVRIRR